MNAHEKKLFLTPATPKIQIPVSSCLTLMLSLCLFGCHLSSDKPTQTGSNGSTQASRGPEADSVKPLPKVVLIGDSISGYYTPAALRELAGLIEPKGFSRTTSSNVLARLDEVISTQPDVIHLNCGLWDLIVSTNTGKAQVSLDEYKSNLEKIFQRLLKETHAKVIWATTTPVVEQQQLNPRPKGYGRIVRREADVKAYNSASVKIAKRFGVKCDDLFEVVTRAGPVEYIDGVHFKEAGNELLGQAVAKAISSNLSKPRKP